MLMVPFYVSWKKNADSNIATDVFHCREHVMHEKIGEKHAKSNRRIARMRLA
jgi:hypothetical protein